MFTCSMSLREPRAAPGFDSHGKIASQLRCDYSRMIPWRFAFKHFLF